MKLVTNLFLVLILFSNAESYGQSDTVDGSDNIIIDRDFCSYLNDSQALQGRYIQLALSMNKDTTCLHEFLNRYQNRIYWMYDFFENGGYQYNTLQFPNLIFFMNDRTDNLRPKSSSCQQSSYKFLAYSHQLSVLIISVNCEKDFEIIEGFENLWTLIVSTAKDLKYPQGFKLHSDSLVELKLQDFQVNKYRLKWIEDLENLDVFYLEDFKFGDRHEIFKSEKIHCDLKEFRRSRVFKRHYLKKINR